MNEDHLNVFLTRYAEAVRAEALATAESKRLRIEVNQLRDAAIQRDRFRRDLGRAEKKVEEWVYYDQQVRKAIGVRRLKNKTIVLPQRPEPIDADIPF